MLGSSTYLEDNTFSTGHQSVNVYGLPEKRYEIRSEDTAVDVQIHRAASARSMESTTAKSSLPSNVGSPDDVVEFFWTDQRVRQCPFDHAVMKVSAIPVLKRDGSPKKLNMVICPICHKKYLGRSSVPESIRLEEYCVLGHELPK